MPQGSLPPPPPLPLLLAPCAPSRPVHAPHRSCPCRLAALLAVAAQAVHLDFEKGLEGWEHSEESKWIGRFEAEVPSSLEKKALKVCATERAMNGPVVACWQWI